MGLGGLILLLALGSVLLTMANAMYSSYRTQRDLLIRNALEANRVYAAKLAESTDSAIGVTRQELAYGAGLLATHMEDPARLAEEAERLRQQTGSLNSVVIVRRDGAVIAASPASLQLKSMRSDWGRRLLDSRIPEISKPFRAPTGRLLIFLSHPVIDGQGHLLGYVGGTIYLNEKNLLHTIFVHHYYRDGSYIYVVDRDGTVIYHPNSGYVGDMSRANPAVAEVMTGGAGAQRIKSLHGVDMLAGYAPVASTGWGIVVQKPTEVTLRDLNGLMLVTLSHSIPFFALSIVFIWWFARSISRPLVELASQARLVATPERLERIKTVSSWYIEAHRLKRALLRGTRLTSSRLARLNHEALTDPLTGLYNRRGVANALRLHAGAGQPQPFSAVTLDVDHFKRINDRNGHDVGDQVLKHIATLIREQARHGDITGRIGGEEFIILLPGATPDGAFKTAERLRRAVEARPNPTGQVVTVSLGVAHYPLSSGEVDAVLKLSDLALYQAKRNGRNRTVLYQAEIAEGPGEMEQAPRARAEGG
ncbi:sensor domain-containing diguanylate cyclase [Ralstonia solanacearum]|uniref:sensor domain-containing diguanylate cyclase n=1 Tax=Ralstonia solanacearum TaxID=305 RepID=UPI00078CBCAC|nr:sensor domain-containing diguanylate cyclase [Ralstonia solanacearum]AMP37303.1 diguanylate cyclase [Ralstonia solanacearum]AXV86125.1 GGDEF domain-containing protein [Ralstonia solanacearum]AXW05632.1 GGDEF domain-containing protein [Ralstonia solanacearum]AXW23373.1 GGDEF domain-containing protein [Ralstonia solanacearum]AXW80305.1 GGDEF domain-containing protein [Ralstonia solanacearum]